MRIRPIHFLAMAYIAFSGNNSVSAQEPDPAFGTNGKVYTSFGSFSSYFQSMVVLPDEKIVATGYNTNTTFSILIARYNSDGTPDLSFNTTGKKQIDFGSAYEFCYSILAQDDEKLVLAGSSNGNAAMARLLPDGSYDGSFSEDGKLTLSFGAGNGSSFQKILLQPDGKIVAIGEAYNTNSFDFAIARFHPDGSADDTFGEGGKTTIDFNNYNDFGRNAILQTDGKIVVVGAAKNSNGNSSIALLRLNADGTPDITFGAGGKTTLTISGVADDYAEAVALDENNRIITGGYSAGDFLVLRFNTNGIVDPSFGTNGYTLTDFDEFQDKAYALTIDDDGNIYLGGHGYETGNGGLFHFAVAKYTSNGLPDTTFDLDGKMTIVMGADQSTVFDMVVQPEGKILFAGQSTGVQGGFTEFALFRLRNTTTGIPGKDPESLDIHLFPNPAADFIRMDPASSGLIRVYDVLGVMVLQTYSAGSTDRMDISMLPAGLYYLSISDHKKTRSFRFIKK
ncbi:MAG: T9SS type A sorting domain-containing protein [Bacteroidota bacterium]